MVMPAGGLQLISNVDHGGAPMIMQRWSGQFFGDPQWSTTELRWPTMVGGGAL